MLFSVEMEQNCDQKNTSSSIEVSQTDASSNKTANVVSTNERSNENQIDASSSELKSMEEYKIILSKKVSLLLKGVNNGVFLLINLE